jgi:hypothetical protein
VPAVLWGSIPVVGRNMRLWGSAVYMCLQCHGAAHMGMGVTCSCEVLQYVPAGCGAAHMRIGVAWSCGVMQYGLECCGTASM